MMPAQPIPGVQLSRLRIHSDSRGFFAEIYRAGAETGRFVQANHSHSKAGVLRGLHYHRRQTDLWYMSRGTAQVALVDLRKQVQRPITWSGIIGEQDRATVLIPPGVAHGFLAISDLDLIYWVSEFHDESDEHTVAWNDPQLSIPWRNTQPILSDRDKRAPGLSWANIPRFA